VSQEDVCEAMRKNLNKELRTIRLTLFLFLFAFSLRILLPHAAWADDPCEDSRKELASLLRAPPVYGTVGLETLGTRTIERYAHPGGTGALYRWSHGASGRIECAYLVYVTSGNKSAYIDLSGQNVQIEDIDKDNIDEIIVRRRLAWDFDCSTCMASVPTNIRIFHLDAAKGVMKNVGRDYTDYIVKDLKLVISHYNDYRLKFKDSNSYCDRKWLALIKETYRTAWFWILSASVIVSILTFTIGLVKSKRMVWFGRTLGFATLLVGMSTAFYSLGEIGWHCVGICEVWQTIEIVTGFHVHSIVMDILSLVLSLFAGYELVTA